MKIIWNKAFIRLVFGLMIFSIIITSICSIVLVGTAYGVFFKDGIYFGDELFMANALNITIILPICILLYLFLLFRKLKGRQDSCFIKFSILLSVAVLFSFIFSRFLYNGSILECRDSIWSIYGKLTM